MAVSSADAVRRPEPALVTPGTGLLSAGVGEGGVADWAAWLMPEFERSNSPPDDTNRPLARGNTRSHTNQETSKKDPRFSPEGVAQRLSQWQAELVSGTPLRRRNRCVGQTPSWWSRHPWPAA